MAYLKHCLNFWNFFLDAALAVEYVLYIITDFLGKIPIKRIPQFAMTVSPFFEIYVLILSILLLHILSQYSTFFNAYLHLFINCHLMANQSVYIL